MLSRLYWDGFVVGAHWRFSILRLIGKRLAGQRIRRTGIFTRLGLRIRWLRLARDLRSRSWGSFRNRTDRAARRIDSKRLERFVVQIAGDLEPVPNLVTPNRRDRVRVLLPGDFPVIEPLVLQGLLHLLNCGIGENDSGRSQES